MTIIFTERSKRLKNVNLELHDVIEIYFEIFIAFCIMYVRR